MDTAAPPEAPAAADAPLGQVLRDVFGFHGFRPHQEEIVRAIVNRQDAFVVMPTGGGKSLCYQLPAHVLPGTCMVVSPLIALMKDQVDAARATGLRAAYLNSSMNAAERADVTRRLLAGALNLIYVSPERFAMPEFVAQLKRMNLSFVAIDEAHCISEWGHDFRPDYLNLSTLVDAFPGVPVTAFTATATLRVQNDIIEKLRLRAPHVVRASFNRPNLFYQVVPKEEPERQILDFVRRHAGESGIIYRTTRKSVEATAAMLVRHNLPALPYHAGLEDATRSKNQEAFSRDAVEVIVATIAFGMGIDKSNVRYVLHGDLPKNVESYYQETGRAGRDGEPAHCLLLFGRGDVPKLRYFIDQMTDEDEKKRALRCLNDMVYYAGVHACRRKQLLAYFGEAYALADCGACDVCAGEVETVDATREAQMVLSAIVRTGQRFGIGHIVDVVTGADTARIRELGHDGLKTYGVGKAHDARYWRVLIDNLLAQDLVAQTDDRYPGLRLQPKAHDVLFAKARVHVLRPKEKPRRAASGAAAAPAGEPFDAGLFEALRAMRKRLAAEAGVPPYVVFSDRTLHEVARVFPATEGALVGITGMGAVKRARYGAPVLEAVAAYRTAHREVQPTRPVV